MSSDLPCAEQDPRAAAAAAAGGVAGPGNTPVIAGT